MKILSITFILLFLTMGTMAQREKSALLPPDEAKKVAKQCSRSSPSDFTDTWEPTREQINLMEAKLAKISKLKAKACCMKGDRVENPNDWYLQYAALVWRGKKIIYISAVSTSPPTHLWLETIDGQLVGDERADDTWKTQAIIVCDGGTAWGVVYELARGKFSDLAVNGVG